jgi:hypothetical protein
MLAIQRSELLLAKKKGGALAPPSKILLSESMAD